ncbi:mitochondrial metal transporter [Tilletia horrida]|uniref:Mitochondrial metal transporter n=1 Tax=Tilletia horrida TaxID=155126 RepID=A0AAN6JXJ8_9BASI|nr:mitochondrial metal transporter [Tilletia horrida]KAK0565039.1 mitochondrial metal transporter [Tilletia horrida]
MAAELTQRKSGTAQKKLSNGTHSHAHSHGHSHTHSHSLNPFASHSHAHSHSDDPAAEADALLAAFKGSKDRGSRITLLGLLANIILAALKAIAGIYLNSAALLADAAHSVSDMASDVVTLFCWKMSQRPASVAYPMGYGKFETMGGLGVSLVLVAGGLGIGFHSYGLLMEALGPTLERAPVFVQVLSKWLGDIASIGALLHDHHGGGGSEKDHHHHSHHHSHEGGAHAEGGALDPNAMWFALLSVLVKEWLYHATLKIAREENSSVLEANAMHHRSDSLSSAVTFLAIGGSWLGFPILDPVGGLLIAFLIGHGGAELLFSALGELSDRGVDHETLHSLEHVLDDVISSTTATGPQKDGRNGAISAAMQGWHSLRAIKSGVSIFIDVALVLPAETTLAQAGAVEQEVIQRLKAARSGVKEVRVRLSTEFPAPSSSSSTSLLPSSKSNGSAKAAAGHGKGE